MWSLPGKDGLKLPWKGRVWCNPPFKNPMPWIEKMGEHDNGIILLPGKSSDSRWGQLVLRTANLVVFIEGRLLFYYPDGTESKGKWMPNILAAYGGENEVKLKYSRIKGVRMGRHR